MSLEIDIKEHFRTNGPGFYILILNDDYSFNEQTCSVSQTPSYTQDPTRRGGLFGRHNGADSDERFEFFTKFGQLEIPYSAVYAALKSKGYPMVTIELLQIKPIGAIRPKV